MYSLRFHKYDDIVYENVRLKVNIGYYLKKGDSFYYVYHHTKENVLDFWVNPPDIMLGEISPSFVIRDLQNYL